MEASRMRRKKLWLSVGTATVVAVLTAGIASAVWSASGTGAGAAAAKVAQGLVVTAVTPTGSGASLYPGGPAGAVSLTIQNPNPYAVTVTNVQWGTPTSTATAICANSNISLDPNAPTSGFNISVPANSTTATTQVPGVLDLAHSAPDGCQGMIFDVPVTVTGVQQ
jgi:hypothetical protein